MSRIGLLAVLAGSFAIASLCSAENNASIKGYIGMDKHYYPREGVGKQNSGNLSLIAELEWYKPLTDNFSFRAKPFFRYDAEDSDRNSSQLKELELQYSNERHFVDVGQTILSWSTTESVNVLPVIVADIINRRDYVADADGQQKLGRPLIGYKFLEDDYSLQLIYFPYFIEDEFDNIHSRESFTQGIFDITESSLFATKDKEREPSAALRFEFAFANTNVAGFHYHGYSATEQFSPVGVDRLTPVYNLENISGLTSETVTDDWLLKSEIAYHRVANQVLSGTIDKQYLKAILGAEYTLVMYNSDADVALFSEYIFDERGESDNASPFENELFIGTRWSVNDQQSTVITGGVVQDLDDHSAVAHLNFNRRILSDFSLDLTIRYYAPDKSTNLYPLRKDSLVKLIFKYHL
jgi:hypothetical protein